MINRKYTCLLFGEGRKDKNFLYALSELPQFKYHTKYWYVKCENAHGESALKILEHCIVERNNADYDLILCFIDLGDLKKNYPIIWNKKLNKLEEFAKKERIKIIWFLDKLEDELKRVLGDDYKNKNKHVVSKEAKKNIRKFINSLLWNRILKHFDKKN